MVRMKALLVGATASVALLGVVPIGLTPASAEPGGRTFEATGGSQSWVVPDGVCDLRVDVAGAQGGDVGGEIHGGDGGEAVARLAVTPGETLIVNVGMQPTGTTGGFNGGGDAGIGTNNESQASAGGGASDIRQGGSTLADRVVVGGGGGGRSNGGNGGGAGGGLSGVAGEGSVPGGGGTQSAGGVSAGNGGDGTLGVGGNGGDGFNIAGGGGGGGWFGGGGAGGAPPDDADLSGGGGGGSGFGPAGTTFSTLPQGGDGLVIIEFFGADQQHCTATPVSTPPTTTPAAAAPAVATEPAFTG